MEPHSVGRQLGVGRIGIGTVLALAPGRAGAVWLGEVATQPGAAVAIRALGARDLALGLGLVRALDTGADPSPWLRASILADAADAIGTVVAWKHLPSRGRLLTFAMASTAAIVGLRTAIQEQRSSNLGR